MRCLIWPTLSRRQRVAAWLVSVLILLLLTGCGGGGLQDSHVAQPPAPPAPPNNAPPPPVNISISSPADGSSVESPSPFVFAVQNAPATYAYMRLFADGHSVFRTPQQALKNVLVYLTPGAHVMELVAYDSNSAILATSQINVTVSGPANPPSVAEIQNLPGWTWCTALLGGNPCASGLGDAVSTKIDAVPDPSLSGSSSQFTVSGTTGYSNALWWYSIGGGIPLNHLTYEADFYVDDASLPEALEFDVNQSYGGLRYTWGTECSYKNTGKWDVWDPEHLKWQKTNVPCPQVASKQWHHLRWEFERVNGQVHYVSVTVDSTTTPVDIYFNPQQNWTRGEDINVAFQMDGDSRQDPFNVWLDNVTLRATY